VSEFNLENFSLRFSGAEWETHTSAL
jgi:hypothetical protein